MPLYEQRKFSVTSSVLVRFLYAAYKSQAKLVYACWAAVSAVWYVYAFQKCVRVSTVVWYLAKSGVTSHDTSTGLCGTFQVSNILVGEQCTKQLFESTCKSSSIILATLIFGESSPLKDCNLLLSCSCSFLLLASGFPVLQPNVPVACDSGKMEDCLSGPPADSMFDTVCTLMAVCLSTVYMHLMLCCYWDATNCNVYGIISHFQPAVPILLAPGLCFVMYMYSRSKDQ